jgi:predicted DsbA family dithiol-disulfide isomerase
MVSTGAKAVQIDFVGDVVCPWCFLGWWRLKTALAARPAWRFDIAWRPYQLQFDIPPEGLPYRAFMAQLFPDAETRQAMDDRLTQLGAVEGLNLRLDLIPMRPNTNAAHRLISWATLKGIGGQAAEAVMRAYFTEGRDIGDPQVLAAIGKAIGLDIANLDERLASGADSEMIDHECRMANEAGIQGVPFTIMAGRVAVSGAESAEHFLKALDQALAAG